MSNHLKRFTNHNNYNAHISTGAAVLPNVCVCDNESEIHYNETYDDNYPVTMIINNKTQYRYTPNQKFVVYSGQGTGSDQVHYYHFGQSTAYDYNRLWGSSRTITGPNRTVPDYFDLSFYTDNGYIYNSTLKEWLYRGKNVSIHMFDIITFTIDSVQYQAEEGMTWDDWVNSNYNTDNKFDTRFGTGEYWIVIRNERDKFVVLNNNQQNSKYMILSNGNYITESYLAEPE